MIVCAFGQGFLNDCGPGTVFDENLMICGWPSVADDQSQEDDNSSNTNPCQTDCPANGAYCQLPAENSNQFIICNFGQPVYQDCPFGLVYDHSIKVCNWA